MSQQNPHLPRQRAGGAHQADRQRQFALDAITARYVEEYQAGKHPRLEDYTRQYPQYAQDIAEFIMYYHAIAEDLAAPAAVPAMELSAGAERALARIRGQGDRHIAASRVAESEPGALAPVDHIIARGVARGFTPPQLAAAVGISPDILTKLDAKVITATTIPRTLVERLAQALAVAPAAIASYLGMPAQTAGSFFYAERPPDQERQQPFIEAVQTSRALDDARKREWAEIVRHEVASGE